MARNLLNPASAGPTSSDAVQQVVDQRPGTAASAAVPAAGPAVRTGAQSFAHQSIADAQLSAIVTAVEQQLARYFGAMTARADAVQQASEVSRLELVDHFQRQIDALTAEHERARVVNEGYGQALQDAIEERLTKFATSQHWRVGEVESRIEELQHAARRVDEQSSALVDHVNETSSTLSRRLDDTGRALAAHLDERTMSLSQRVDDSINGMRTHLSEQVSTFGRRIEDTENKVIDRALAMEERINEQTGVRLAGVEATIGRISRSVDDAIVALSHRVIELENSNNEVAARVDEIAAQIAAVDQEAIDTLRDQMSSTIGESMLVRIELERVASSTGEQFDKFNLRLAELAADIAESTLDVSTAVQLERLEEIERALIELDPDQFVRKSELAGTGASDGAAPSGPASTDIAPPSIDGNPSESNLSSW